MLKPFSQTTYEADDNAKHLIVDLFRNTYGCQTWVNGDKYGIDLIGKDNNATFGVEVEVKHEWTEEFHFPWDTVHIPARKVKFIDTHPVVYYAVVNHWRTFALITSTARFDQCKLVRKDTKHTRQEWFMAIPLELWSHVQL